MSKEQLLQELVDAYEKVIRTATEAAQRGVTRQGGTWGPREIVVVPWILPFALFVHPRTVMV